MKRALDILLSLAVLLVASPLLLVAMLAIRLASPGPVFFRARRVGLGGVAFDMLKLRSMHVNEGGPVITWHGDNRIFPLGRLLRKLKIDELPQFINVLRGDMSVVGPRPEDPKIVREHYTDWMMETLDVRPGITSPGVVFYYLRGEGLVDPADPERSYVEKLLPPKLALDRAYIDRATFLADLCVILHTAAAIAGEAVGRPVQPRHRDIASATRWVAATAFLAGEGAPLPKGGNEDPVHP